MEVLIIKKLDGGLRGLRNKTKTVDQARVGYYLGKLAEVNDGLYQDYLLKYIEIQRTMKQD